MLEAWTNGYFLVFVNLKTQKKMSLNEKLKESDFVDFE